VKVSRRHGRLRLRLEPVEVDLLDSLFDQLEAVLDGGPDDGLDEIRLRLSPSAYRDDPDAAAEFRTLTETALRGDRDERIAACRAELAQGGDIDLGGPDTARRWIQVLNDLRLALGTGLGVSEDDDGTLEADDPQADVRAVYYWLTAVQDSLVGHLMR
jgi:hypothetical protein